MREIRLTKGASALVDEEDFRPLSQHKWYCDRKGYARRNVTIGHCKQTAILMHRAIMNAPLGIEVDHRNRNRLDNRRINLRLATDADNARNQTRYRNNTSGAKGVDRMKDGKFRVRIHCNGKSVFLGCFDNLPEASAVYNAAAVSLHGDFASQN